MRVRAARVAAGLTADDWAKRVGMGESSLLNLEWSRKRPEEKILKRIALALNLDWHKHGSEH